jgi:hypothetical protein
MLLAGKYTGLSSNPAPTVDSLRKDLGKSHLDSTLATLQEEIRFAVHEVFGEYHDWTAVVLFPRLQRVVTLASQRIFVGMPLSRDEDWIDLVLSFTGAAGDVIGTFQLIPPFLRAFLAPLVPSVRATARLRKRATEMLRPTLNGMIQSDKEAHGKGGSVDHPPVAPGQLNLAAWSMVGEQDEILGLGAC